MLCKGRSRLGIGIGWNEVEFVGLNESFRNRGKRSEEQVAVMRALWKEEHVTFRGNYHKIDDAGINPRPTAGNLPVWYGGHHEKTLPRIAKIGRWLDPEQFSTRPDRTEYDRRVAAHDRSRGA